MCVRTSRTLPPLRNRAVGKVGNEVAECLLPDPADDPIIRLSDFHASHRMNTEITRVLGI